MTASPRTQITVRLTPRAGREAIDGWRDGVLLVRVAAAPVDGAANASLVRLLAKALGVAPSAVEILRGARSRVKVVEIAGMTEAEMRDRLGL